MLCKGTCAIVASDMKVATNTAKKESQSVKVGAFVLVEISSKQSKQTIVAKVMEIDGDEVQLFLMASDTNCIYRLPEREYVSWESISNIRKVLPQPRLSKSSTKDRLC
ncbi:uncharacterized protein LOC128214297 [Mya arenaria]|uniref:uncharacterized protein LOC128214297 n=1 Tax=Mya arenaria TaxID=6604 RepID=UPI0022E993D6|nr:uncharacterized protein LOC128214297 [Mya arenaria]